MQRRVKLGIACLSIVIGLIAVIGLVAASGRPYLLRLPSPLIEIVLLRDFEIGGATLVSDVERLFDIEKVDRMEFWSTPIRKFPEELEGATFFKAHLGEYRGIPWSVDVVCFFAFDESQRLVFADVRKEYDAI